MKNIVLCGFMGCGKSTVGKILAEKTGMTLVDMDSYIETVAGRTISEIFATDGEAAFRRMEHEACRELGGQSDLIIATGGGAVLRDENVTALKQNGTIVWLEVDAACVLGRLAGDTTRPLLQREDKEAAVSELLAQRTPLYARAADCRVDGNGEADTVAAAIFDALSTQGMH